METTLGIDLGTNSIGLALVDQEEQQILYSGIRIFPEGINKNTIGLGVKEESQNATRRAKRQMRRQYFRKKLRKAKLLELLIAYDMCPLKPEDVRRWKNWNKQQKSTVRQFPDTPAFREWLKQNPYELRKRAVTEDVTRPELGRILYQMIQRRGFLSSRKGKEEGKIFTGKDRMVSIDETRKNLQKQTLGAYLYDIAPKNGEKYRFRTERVRARYTLRDMYIREFEIIWQRQAGHLGLAHEQATRKKNIFLEGSATNVRNSKLITHLQAKYGRDHVLIEDTRITVTFQLPLKEVLGGKIEIEEEQLKFKSNESVLFWQRPLRSQKSLLSKCVFEGRNFYDSVHQKWIIAGPTPAPLSHPEFEEFRAYQFINNIIYGKNEHLTAVQREAVFELMCTESKDFNFEKIPKHLKLFEKFNFDDTTKVPACTTISQLRKLFPRPVWEEKRKEIWHCFYFYDDNALLFEKLQKDYVLQTNDLEKIKKIRLSEGYGNVSLKAIRRINPYLKKGYAYSTAVLLGGIRNSFGKRFEYFKEYEPEIEKAVCRILKEKNAEGEAIRKIKDYLVHNRFGFAKNDRAFQKLYHHSQAITTQAQKERLPETGNLRNPIVQQGLNELRRTVNKLLATCREKYGPSFKFDHIHVEMGRELRSSKTEREKQSRQIRENEKKNEAAKIKLAEYGLKAYRDNIQKYLLYKEIEEKGGTVCCPYTGKTLNISHVLGSDNSVQIEHIIPYSISLDDSLANKTLCDATFNREKGELTPYDFYQKDPSPEKWGAGNWEEIEDRAFRLLPYAKAQRFIRRKPQESNEFISRQLNDTRYISKKAVEYLSAICSDVKAFPGRLTAELRHLWGINNILQSAPEITFSLPVSATENRREYYVITNEKNEALRLLPKQGDVPQTEKGELLLAGRVERKVFKCKGMPEFPTDVSDGKYWCRIKLSSSVTWSPLFAPKPISADGQIILKGRIEKGVFVCNQLKQKLKTGLPDGSYWISLPVISQTFKEGESVNNNKLTSRQVQLFGRVREGIFRCNNYQCPASGADGNFWCTLDTDTAQPAFTPIKNAPPGVGGGQIILTGDVDDKGIFHADDDLHYEQPASLPKGKYYGIFTVESCDPTLIPIELSAPKTSKGENLIEGNIWVDEHTGEVRFDPKKNREDQRHHAIDAIVIALSSQNLFQRLSTYNARRENKKRGLDSTEHFPSPWPGFVHDVRQSVAPLLVSYKQNPKTLCKISKTLYKDGKKIHSCGNAVRGQLHKETVYGQRTAPGATEKSYHIRKDIRELKTSKHIGKVVDITIRQMLLKHLQENYHIDITQEFNIPSDAFFKEGVYRIFLPNKHGETVPIKKIRMKEKLGNAEQLKNNINQYVNPDKNHHVMIYQDADGNLKEEIVSFWSVIERQNQGQPIYQLPRDSRNMVSILQINDTFLIGLKEEELEVYKNDLSTLSKHLYRVQKLSGMYYTFRHHLASTLNNEREEFRIQSLEAWKRANPVKLQIDEIGRITFLNGPLC